jgi:iron complex outermembrane receptor protein
VRPLGEEREGEEPPTLRVTGSYTYLRSTECDPERLAGAVCAARRAVPLTPRHAVGVVASVEEEGKSRVGLEVYWTGRQALEENPYRTTSRAYVVVGLLAERAVTTRAGTARIFVNL